MAIKKYKMHQLLDDETLVDVHPETDAEVVLVEKGETAYKGNADNVQDALKEIYEMAQNGTDGTVTSVDIKADAGSGLTTSGGPITSSGSMSIGVASGYSIPSSTLQNEWTAKYSKPASGIPATDLSAEAQASLGKADSALQENQNIDISGDATGSGKTSIKVTLAKTGVAAGSYTAVTVNEKGLVTAGAQLIEVGGTNQTTPSASLAIGGLFFEEI